MATERDSQAELENKGVDEAAEASEKPDPTERNGRDPEGELSPLIYPTGWHDPSKRLGFNFKRIKIRGKPLSETVMEDRRAGW